MFQRSQGKVLPDWMDVKKRKPRESNQGKTRKEKRAARRVKGSETRCTRSSQPVSMSGKRRSVLWGYRYAPPLDISENTEWILVKYHSVWHGSWGTTDSTAAHVRWFKPSQIYCPCDRHMTSLALLQSSVIMY
jgi:hypothetical protein